MFENEKLRPNVSKRNEDENTSKNVNDSSTMQSKSSSFTVVMDIFKCFILPGIGIPFSLFIFPLQDPTASKGYETNWTWVGILIPLASIYLSLFPTYIVSTIMGRLHASLKNYTWRFASVAFAATVGGVLLYGLMAVQIYPAFSGGKNFPLPFTPIWLPSLLAIVASFSARYIRLVSDWKFIDSSHPQSSSGPSAATLRYTLCKIKTLVRNGVFVYCMSAISSSLVLLLSKPFSLESISNLLDSVTNQKEYHLPILNSVLIFLLLPLGKFLARYCMALVLSSGGFYEWTSDISSQDSSIDLPNIDVIVMGCEHWWSITEILLIVNLQNHGIQLALLPAFTIAESAYFLVRTLTSYQKNEGHSSFDDSKKQWNSEDILRTKQQTTVMSANLQEALMLENRMSRVSSKPQPHISFTSTRSTIQYQLYDAMTTCLAIAILKLLILLQISLIFVMSDTQSRAFMHFIGPYPFIGMGLFYTGWIIMLNYAAKYFKVDALNKFHAVVMKKRTSWMALACGTSAYIMLCVYEHGGC